MRGKNPTRRPPDNGRDSAFPAFPRGSIRTAASLLLVWLGCLTSPGTADGVRFESKRLEIKVTPEQEEVEASFAFTNQGGTPARIESVTSDCACLKTEAPKGEIPPGGNGVVRGQFQLGKLRGIVEKQLLARISQNGTTRPVLLEAVIIVPDLIQLEPRTLSWTTGPNPAEQSFKVHMTGPGAIHLLSVECSRQNFQFRVETRVAGREYVVHAKPLKADQPTIGLVRFNTDCRLKKFKTTLGFVRIRRP